MKTVIIGLGNPIVGDDAIGIKVTDYIRDTYTFPVNTEILSDISIGGFGLVELFRGYDKVILIDAIETGNNPIGKVIQLKSEEFALALHTSDYHNMDFFTALEFANQMYDNITEDISIIGIEIINPMEFSYDLSYELQSEFREIVKRVYDILLVELREEIVTKNQ